MSAHRAPIISSTSRAPRGQELLATAPGQPRAPARRIWTLPRPSACHRPPTRPLLLSTSSSGLALAHFLRSRFLACLCSRTSARKATAAGRARHRGAMGEWAGLSVVATPAPHPTLAPGHSSALCTFLSLPQFGSATAPPWPRARPNSKLWRLLLSPLLPPSVSAPAPPRHVRHVSLTLDLPR